MTAHIPFEDLPNHLARQYVIAELPSDALYREFYSVHWQLVPNLAMDLFTSVVGRILPIDVTVRIFCLLTILSIFLGVRSINLALDPVSRLYRLAPILCYGGPVQFGFLNYCFGVGAALLVFALYLRKRDVPLARAVALFAPLAGLLLLCHIAAFILFAAAIVGAEIALAFPRARAALAPLSRAVCFLLPPLLALLLLGPSGAPGAPIEFGSWHDKLEGAAAITLYGMPGIELAILVVAMVTLAVALVTQRVQPARIGIGIVAVQTVLWLIAPRHAMGGGYVDYRLPWAIALFGLATLSPAIPTRSSTALAAVCAILAILRIGSLGINWLRMEPVIAGVDRALDLLPPGAHLLSVIGTNPSASAGRRPPLTNLGAYAVIRRQAYWPDLFADIPGQILRLTPRYAHSWRPVPSSLTELDPSFDHILVLAPEFVTIAPSLKLRCLAQGMSFRLYAVDRATPPTSTACPA